MYAPTAPAFEMARARVSVRDAEMLTNVTHIHTQIPHTHSLSLSRVSVRDAKMLTNPSAEFWHCIRGCFVFRLEHGLLSAFVTAAGP